MSKKRKDKDDWDWGYEWTSTYGWKPIKSSKVVVSSCAGHEHPITVLTKPIAVMAGSKLTKKLPIGCTILDLCGDLKPPVQVKGLRIPLLESKYVRIEWPDYSTVPMEASHWAALIRAVVKAGRPVFVGCLGGHGRTGTALVIMAHFLGAIPEGEDPILWLRARYCQSAVESEVQVQYITHITGRVTTAKASGVGGVTYSMPPLCTEKPGPPIGDGKTWCNLERDHDGPCDTRPRQVILAERDEKGKSAATPPGEKETLPSNPKWEPAWCHKSEHCMLREGHDGPCKSRWSGAYL